MPNASVPALVAAMEVPWVGDHLALDLLNTQAMRHGGVVDFWRTDEDVGDWLGKAGVAAAAGLGRAPTQLLQQARSLREAVRAAVSTRVQGQVPDPAELNRILERYRTSWHLHRDVDGRLAIQQVAHGDAVARLLGPVAQAAAQLMVEGDFSLVRQCEHPDCVLWFYDRTKSHKRRWCSMAQCGNRHKAAQFRKRSGASKG
jgi:predicted RNA-binding Zn ribbon-like protein